MVYEDFKIQQKKKKNSDKVLRDKAFNVANTPKYDEYQRGIASMVYNFFDRKSEGGGLIIKLNEMNNQLKNYTNQLLEKFKKEDFIHHFLTNQFH